MERPATRETDLHLDHNAWKYTTERQPSWSLGPRSAPSQSGTM